MVRFLPLMLLLGACEHSIGIDDAGFVDEIPTDSWLDNDPVDEVDTSMYDGAILEIVTPQSGMFLPLEDRQRFEARLLDAEGNELPFEDILWTTNLDTNWSRKGTGFWDHMDVGLHDFTARVELPNGDRLAYTVGGVLIQSKFAGTYAGLFSADVTYDGLIVTCSGSSTLVIDPYGENALGEGNCLASLMGQDLPLRFLYDLENKNGHLVGTAGADIFGWLQYDFPAEGGVLQNGPELNIGWGGHVGFGNFNIDIDAGLDAPRVSRDAQ